jgi:crossover junction endodeoxyribonuclease RusA
MKLPIRLELPFPPTVNTYWRRVGHRTILSASARAYRQKVEIALVDGSLGSRHEALTCDLAVEIEFRPPDRRKRDIDNLPKGLLDALKHAGVYADDSQVRQLNLRFGLPKAGGLSLVRITIAESAA